MVPVSTEAFARFKGRSTVTSLIIRSGPAWEGSSDPASPLITIDFLSFTDSNYILRGHSKQIYKLSSTFDRIFGKNLENREIGGLKDDNILNKQERNKKIKILYEKNCCNHNALVEKYFIREIDDNPILSQFRNDFHNATDEEKFFISLTFLRHHRIPVNLLDFTTNIKIAAYFACARNSECDGVLWFIKKDPLWKNGREMIGNRISETLAPHSLDSLSNQYRIMRYDNLTPFKDNIIFFDPKQHPILKCYSKNIDAQQSVFLYRPKFKPSVVRPFYKELFQLNENEGIEILATNEPPLSFSKFCSSLNTHERETFHGRVIIPKELKDKILDLLEENSAINEKSLNPDGQTHFESSFYAFLDEYLQNFRCD